MCGIVGFIRCGSRETLAKATDSMAHRGPDGQGQWWAQEQQTGFGHRRLSIIDLSEGGAQPMWNEQQNLLIVYNGEVYNYQEIRIELEKEGISFHSQSDTEVILKGYQKWGVQILDRLNGMFAFLIYNTQTQEVFGARDRLGIKPFYFYHQDQKLAVASEIKAILKCEDYKVEADIAAIHTPVHFQTCPQTGFKDIQKLPPGHYLRFRAGGELEIRPYWQIQIDEQPMDKASAMEQLKVLLESAVRYQMISDVPVGLLLSGGLDSSIIGALMAKQTDNPIHSFTITFDKADLKQQGHVDDSYYAQKIADQLGFQHHEIYIEPAILDLLPKMIWHVEEPLADPAAINTFLISEAARTHGITVLLNGMGGDEVFAGYRIHRAALLAQKVQRFTPGFLRKLILTGLRQFPEANQKRSFKYVRWLKKFLELSQYTDFERQVLAKDATLGPAVYDTYFQAPPTRFRDTHYYQREAQLFAQANGASYLAKICQSDSSLYMPDHNLNYSDKAMMAASVEGRPPLIDHRIVDFLFHLPPKLKINKGIQKYLLKEVALQYLPREIIHRPKAPFNAPLRAWIKNDLHEMVQDVLSPKALKERGIFNPKYIQEVIKLNQKGMADYSQLIFKTLVIENWYRTFIDG